MSNREFQIRRDDIRQTRFVDAPSPALEPGQLRLRVDKVAFTANNVTYAVAGDYLKYWNFFPTNEEGWGKLPVWGFADVVESAEPSITVGERIYGYFPLSSELVVTAGKIHEAGFTDVAPHRRELNAIYNQYTRVGQVAGYEQEELNALLRPMFLTAFLIDDFLADNDFFGAEQLVLSSASSKTGYATAFLLNEAQGVRRLDSTVGLTSDSRIEFVESLDCYQQVLAYGEHEQLPSDVATVYVDFAGSGPLRRQLHDYFGDSLKYDCAVGLTDWENRGGSGKVKGVRPQMFFAPAQAQKRIAEWGGATLQRKMGEAFGRFLAFSTDNLLVTPLSGEEAITKTYLAMVENEASPERGFIFLLN